MSKPTAKQVSELEAKIRFHQRLYYDLNEPEISDTEFDLLWDQLKNADPHSPVLNERSQDKYGDEMPHSFPMGSLTKVKTVEEIFAKFKGKRVVISPKIDGASAALRYREDRLIVGLSRGRTETQRGRIITPNIAKINGIPLSLPSDEHMKECEVRGEAYIRKDSFFGKMDQPGYDGMSEGYANPRNLASSSLTCKDPNIASSHEVRFLACKMVQANGTGFVDSQDFDFLAQCGFEVPVHTVMVLDDLDELRQVVAEWDNRRAGLPYETDGIVIRLADAKEYNSLGFSGVCPNGAVAYKYSNKSSAVTTIRSIEWSISRLGFACPVAHFDPVQVGGVEISKCTLNNPTWMKEKYGDISIGAKVRVDRQNDVIPGIVDVIEFGSGDTSQPIQCPSCGAKLEYDETSDGGEGAKLRCPNKISCKAQLLDSVLNLLRKLDVKGISDAIILKLFDGGLIEQVWDVLDLTQDELVNAGFGKRQSEIIFNSVSHIETKPVNILAAVGVECWSRRMVKHLIDNSNGTFTVDRLLAGDFPYDELVIVRGIGPAKAKLLADAFAPGARGTIFLSELLKRVRVTKPDGDITKIVGGKLATLSFCLSGSMPRGKKQIEADILAAGGTVKDSVGKGLSYLVSGDGSGSKTEKALKLGIPILSEDKLYSMIGE